MRGITTTVWWDSEREKKKFITMGPSPGTPGFGTIIGQETVQQGSLMKPLTGSSFRHPHRTQRSSDGRSAVQQQERAVPHDPGKRQGQRERAWTHAYRLRACRQYYPEPLHVPRFSTSHEEKHGPSLRPPAPVNSSPVSTFSLARRGGGAPCKSDFRHLLLSTHTKGCRNETPRLNPPVGRAYLYIFMAAFQPQIEGRWSGPGNFIDGVANQMGSAPAL
jgi:hypothetical protein